MSRCIRAVATKAACGLAMVPLSLWTRGCSYWLFLCRPVLLLKPLSVIGAVVRRQLRKFRPARRPADHVGDAWFACVCVLLPPAPHATPSSCHRALRLFHVCLFKPGPRAYRTCSGPSRRWGTTPTPCSPRWPPNANVNSTTSPQRISPTSSGRSPRSDIAQACDAHLRRRTARMPLAALL